MARDADSARRLWTERMQRFSRSGWTVAAFCQAERVSAPSFYQWRKKLAAPGSRTAYPRPVGRQTFVPLGMLSTVQVEIHLPNGTRVCLPGGDAVLIGAAISAAGTLPAAARKEGRTC